MHVKTKGSEKDMSTSMLTSMPIQVDWLIRIIVAAICGSAIGYERATQRKIAGIRTHILVAVASALFMIVSKYAFADILLDHGIALDPSRIAAQVVTGISFIGAGTILVKGEQISGLTTAAGVWATSAIGMAIGAGMYVIGLLVTAFLFLIQIIFHDDSIINKIIFRIRFSVQIEADNTPGIIKQIHDELAFNQVDSIIIKILDMDNDHIVVTADGIIKNKESENTIIMALEKYTNIKRVTYSRGGK